MLTGASSEPLWPAIQVTRGRPAAQSGYRKEIGGLCHRRKELQDVPHQSPQQSQTSRGFIQRKRNYSQNNGSGQARRRTALKSRAAQDCIRVRAQEPGVGLPCASWALWELSRRHRRGDFSYEAACYNPRQLAMSSSRTLSCVPSPPPSIPPRSCWPRYQSLWPSR